MRSSREAFEDIVQRKIDPEMLELAQHILETKAGEFEPEKFDDRYEEALAELVKAKIEGRKIIPLRQPEPTKPNDLLEALRLSAAGKEQPPRKPNAKKTGTAKNEAEAPAKRRKAS